MFCFRMSQYMLEYMFPSMKLSSPVPAAIMQTQTMMLPPPLYDPDSLGCTVTQFQGVTNILKA